MGNSGHWAKYFRLDCQCFNLDTWWKVLFIFPNPKSPPHIFVPKIQTRVCWQIYRYANSQFSTDWPQGLFSITEFIVIPTEKVRNKHKNRAKKARCMYLKPLLHNIVHGSISDIYTDFIKTKTVLLPIILYRHTLNQYCSNILPWLTAWQKHTVCNDWIDSEPSSWWSSWAATCCQSSASSVQNIFYVWNAFNFRSANRKSAQMHLKIDCPPCN